MNYLWDFVHDSDTNAYVHIQSVPMHVWEIYIYGIQTHTRALYALRKVASVRGVYNVINKIIRWQTGKWKINVRFEFIRFYIYISFVLYKLARAERGRERESKGKQKFASSRTSHILQWQISHFHCFTSANVQYMCKRRADCSHFF